MGIDLLFRLQRQARRPGYDLLLGRSLASNEDQAQKVTWPLVFGVRETGPVTFIVTASILLIVTAASSLRNE